MGITPTTPTELWAWKDLTVACLKENVYPNAQREAVGEQRSFRLGKGGLLVTQGETVVRSHRSIEHPKLASFPESRAIPSQEWPRTFATG
jgi:hypothetical protein